MKGYKSIKVAVFTFLLLGFLSGCGDNPLNNISSGKAPNIPKLNQHKPEISYFKDNYPAGPSVGAEEYMNFNTAASLVIGSSAALTAGLGLSTAFLSVAQSRTAQKKNGKWVWEYSYTHEGESVSVRLVAESVDGDKYKWKMFLSSSNTDGQSFEDYKFMEGQVAKDGKNGSWKVFPFAPGQNATPNATFDWQVQSDSKKTLTFRDYESDTLKTKLEYIEDPPEFTITVETNNDEPDKKVFWNTNTGTGYMNDGSQKLCWDSNFKNTACN